MASEKPLLVVLFLEVLQCKPELFNILEAIDPQELFFQSLDEPFCDSISFRLANEGGARNNATPIDLPLEVMANILCAMIVAQLEPLGDILFESPKATDQAF